LEGERKNMNTVKRWLAGFLSFAMIFTSAAFTNLGAVNVFAASGVEVTATTEDGTASHTVTFKSLEEALDSYWATGLTKPFDSLVTIKLLGNETLKSVHTIYSPVVIDLNGFTVDPSMIEPGYDCCLRPYDLRTDGYPKQIVIDFHDPGAETVYNWVYDEDRKPDWYVASVTNFCPNCGAEDTVKATGTTIYNADKEQYEYREKGFKAPVVWKPGNADSDDWLISGLPWISKVGGQTVKENGLPVVYVRVRKINNGEVQNVKATVSAVTDSAEIKEIIKYQKGYNINEDGFVEFKDDRNGIIEGNTAATCLKSGAQIYKLIVNDPDGELVATEYIRDSAATPKVDHVEGRLIGYQIASISKDVYGSESAALRAAKKSGVEAIKTEKREDGKWYYMYWPVNYTEIDGTDAGNTTGVIEVSEADVRENGTFDYRFAYECDNGLLEEHKKDGEYPVFGKTQTSEVYPNATSHAEALDGHHSVCEYWVIKPITDKYDFTKGGKVVDYTYTASVEVVENVDISQYTNNALKKNYYEKLDSDVKHTMDTASGYTLSGYGTCDDKDSGYLRTYRCSVCNNPAVEEYVKVNHQFVTSKVKLTDLTKLNTQTVTGVDGDRREYTDYTTVNEMIDTLTYDSDCIHEGGTYRWCEGVVYPSGYNGSTTGKPTVTGHWAISGTPIAPKGHNFVATADTWKWTAWDPDGNNYEGAQVGKEVKTKTTSEAVFAGTSGYDYRFETDQKCNNKDCNEVSGHVVYHSEDGTDGYDENNIYHVYNAITMVKKPAGADCRSAAETTFTVKDLTTDGTTPVTLTYVSTGDRGPHNLEVTEVNWSDDYEAATITGYCTVDGCVAKDGHPGYDSAIVSRTVDKETGITTFTATYKGKVVGTKKAYTLKNAVVTFDPTKIEDTNLVTGVKRYCAPVDEAAPEVKVEIDGVEIDSSLYTVNWVGNQKPVGKGGVSGVAKTARYVWAEVDWSDDIYEQEDVTVLPFSKESKHYNATSKKKFDNMFTTVIDSEESEYIISDPETDICNPTYNPEMSYSIVTDSGTKNATVKYTDCPEPVALTTAEEKAIYEAGGTQTDVYIEIQRRIEGLEYNLDEVTGIKDAGEHYIYAQITEDGYTTYSGLVAILIIDPKPVFADVDNVTVVEGTEPEFTLQARDITTGDVVEIDREEYRFTTLGGGELTALTPGTYKVQIVSENYEFRSDRYNDYVCVLTVISIDDSTAADQAKAKAIGDQTDALGENPTEAEVAAARAAYDKLSDAAKARISPETLKKLTDAEAAIQAQKDADTAIAAAKGYEADAAVKAALDALNAALAKGDTAEIKTATTNLNNAITAVKEAAAAKDAANAAIAGAKGYETNADVKAALDALNAALAKNDTAAIKTATTNLNNAVAKAKQPAPAPAKSASKITFSTKSKSIKASKVKKKAQKFQIKIKKTGNGKVTYKKSSGSKKLSVSKSGKITVKKGTKKGTYKIKVKATIAETSTYKKATKSQTIKVKVK
jgi:hypothetical protein